MANRHTMKSLPSDDGIEAEAELTDQERAAGEKHTSAELAGRFGVPLLAALYYAAEAACALDSEAFEKAWHELQVDTAVDRDVPARETAARLHIPCEVWARFLAEWLIGERFEVVRHQRGADEPMANRPATIKLGCR